MRNNTALPPCSWSCYVWWRWCDLIFDDLALIGLWLSMLTALTVSKLFLNADVFLYGVSLSSLIGWQRRPWKAGASRRQGKFLCFFIFALSLSPTCVSTHHNILWYQFGLSSCTKMNLWLTRRFASHSISFCCSMFSQSWSVSIV